MTNQRKIEVLRGARENINNNSSRCICYAIENAMSSAEYVAWHETHTQADRLLLFGLIAPPDADLPYWFPANYHGKKRRLGLIDEAIKKLEAEL